jgi:ADP-heptose:LPS heptosyltransferase
MRTLVINLTRFGDLLQTQPVFTGLKEKGDTVGLVCLGNFLPAAGLLRHLDAVFPVPGARFLANLDQAWPLALGDCLGFVDRTRRVFAPDRVINLTPSLSARLLARTMSCGQVFGFGMDEFGFGTYSTPWAAFLEATSRHRGSSPFNLVDLFFKAAHLGDAPREFQLVKPDPEDLVHIQAVIASSQPCSGQGDFAGLAGLQLGASAAARQWPTEFFVRTAEFLWDRHRLLPVLLGAKGEEPLGADFTAQATVPHVNLIGRTELNQLAAAVSLLRVLVTNDTGTMHLAAGHGVPILAIFLATAQPWDTGPYLPGACCIEPDLPCHPCPFGQECPIDCACRSQVRPEAVTAYLDGYLSSGRSDLNGKWPELPGLGVRAWETVCEPEGFLGLRSLSGHDGGERAVWNALQRLAWRHFLDDEPLQFAGSEADGLSEEFRARLWNVLFQASGLLGVLVKQAEVLGVVPHQAMRAKFMATWQRLESLFSSEPALCTLAHLWLHLSQGEGQDLKRFSDFARKVSGFVASLSSLLAPRR